MSEKSQEKIIDVRSMPPPARHNYIFKIFDSLKPGEELLVVNDHEPVHLVQFMKHERRDFDYGAYRAYQKSQSEWVGVFKKKRDSEPVSDNSSTYLFTSFDRERSFDENSFSPIPVFTSKDYKVILAYFKAGQFIPVHTPNIDLVLLVHLGQGEMVAGSEKRLVKSGDLVVVPKGEQRGIRALTNMEVLHIVSPPPNDHDHEEVSRKLSAGTFE